MKPMSSSIDARLNRHVDQLRPCQKAVFKTESSGREIECSNEPAFLLTLASTSLQSTHSHVLLGKKQKTSGVPRPG